MAQSNESRGMRDEANVGPDPRQVRNLIPLRDLGDFKVADGEPDIRGWTVYTSTGRQIGEVEELLVDTSKNEVVMLDIDLKRNDRHTLAPIRAAWVDRSSNRVVIDSAQLDVGDDAVPSLSRRGPITDQDERDFDERYRRAYGERGYDVDHELRVRREHDALSFGRAPVTDRPADRPADIPVVDDRTGSERRAHGRDADRPADDARDLDQVLGLEPDTLDAQTRAGVPAHPHGDRYLEPDRIVVRLPREEAEPVEDESPPVNATGDRSVRYPRSVADANARQGPAVVEETVVRRRVVDPSELTPEERKELPAGPGTPIVRDE